MNKKLKLQENHSIDNNPEDANFIDSLVQSTNVPLLFEGAMGSVCIGYGANYEDIVYWNQQKPEVIKRIHETYLTAGADVLKTNTFGLSQLNNLTEIQLLGRLACQHVKQINPRFWLYDMAPIVSKINESSDLNKNQEIYQKQIEIATAQRASGLLLETFYDLEEAEHVLSIIKQEKNKLPIILSITPMDNWNIATYEQWCQLASKYQVTALGLNCGNGPVSLLLPAKILNQLSSVPLILQPNSGIPIKIDGQATYPVQVKEFITVCKQLLEITNVKGIGGCCGTTPQYISELYRLIHRI